MRYSSEERVESMNLATSALAILPPLPETCTHEFHVSLRFDFDESYVIVLLDSELLVSD